MMEPGSGARRTANILPLALLTVIALLVFARPLVKYEVLNFRDHTDYFQPLRLFTAQELRRGHLPLWNPYNASGEPWLANPQTGVFYPPTWIFLVIPFTTAYTLYLALHIALLGCSAFLLFRRLASNAAAFVAALSLMLCGPAMSLLDVSNTLTTFAWLPLVLWCALAPASRGVSSVVIAMSFLGGEPFFAACGALVFCGVRWQSHRFLKGSESGGSAAAVQIDIALTAFALSAVQLLPFLALIRGSDRAGHVPADEILRDSMPLSDWVGVIFPPSLVDAHAHQHFIPIVYIGMVAASLAIVGAIVGWRRRAVHVCLGVVALSMFMAAGSYFAPSGYLLTHLPVAILRYPARALPIAAIALHALFAIGFDSLARVVRQWWLPVLFAALVIADLTPVIAPLIESAPFNPHPTPYSPSIARDRKLIRLMTARHAMSLAARRTWISGYQNLLERRFDVWTAAPLVPEAYTRAYEEALRNRERLDEMSIGYVLSDRPIAGLPVVARHHEATMYGNPDAYPLAFWRGSDGRVVGASLLALTTTAAHITIDVPADGRLVVTQRNARGWRATIDGVPVAHTTEGIFRVIPIARGRHEIAWRYRPASLFAGAILTVIGILRLLLSTSFVKDARTKKNFPNAVESA